MDKMEYQHDDEGHPHKSAEAKPLETKRTARMVHEGSFATSAFTSSRSKSRPPGFVASSLDFKSSDTDSAAAPAVTTKPGNKKNSSKKHQEKIERERQYQQQRQYRSGHPTRAQGNFGPPPHSVRSLEDLENMTEEQIYKLFMDDPELHQAFIKATEKEQKGNNVPTTAPVGAQKSRSSSRRKSSSTSKSKRSSTNSKRLKHENTEREFPYFQWLFLFLLIVSAIYKFRKSYSISTSTKELGRGSKNRTGKKQKKKQGGTGKKSSAKKSTSIVEEKAKPNLQQDDSEPVEKKSPPPRRRKKKKPSKIRSTTPSSSITNEEKESVLSQNRGRQNDPELESTDASSGNHEPEIAKLDLGIHADSDLVSALAKIANDEEWQTVTKSSKGERKRKTNSDTNPITEQKALEQAGAVSIIEEKVLEQTVAEKNDNLGEGDIEQVPEKKTIDQPVEVSYVDTRKTEDLAPINDEKETIDTVKATKPVKSESTQVGNGKQDTSKVNNIEKPDIDSKGESTTTIEDDAALALQLHEEEVNLARAANADPQEEEWEEVTVKKKKGNKV